MARQYSTIPDPPHTMNENVLPDRVALYCRVSSEDQAERQTVQAQLDFLRQFCSLYGLQIAGQFVDDGISGAVPLAGRPEGMRLLEASGAHAFGTVLVYRLDRLGRKLSVILDAHEQLERQGVNVRSGTEPIDTSTPVGRFIFQLLGSIAELEKSTISERMILGKNTKARTGKWLGGVIPTGYDVDADGRLVASERTVEQIGMSEAGMVVELFDRIANGSSTLEEARRLNGLGVPSVRRYNGREITVSELWGSSKILSVVKNPMYTGVHVYRGRGGDVERSVPALVSRELFEAAQGQLGRNRTLSTRNAKHDYLLRAKITCGGCGAHFSGLVAGAAGSYAGNRYYRCRTQMNRVTGERPCDAKLIRADWLENLVWEDIRSFADDPGPPLEEARRELRGRLELVAGVEEKRRALLSQLASKENEKERVLLLFRRGTIELSDAEKQLAEIDAEASSIRAMVDAIRSQAELASAYESQIASAAALLMQLRGRIEAIDADCASEDPDARSRGYTDKRGVIELLVASITVETIGAGRGKRANVRIRYLFGEPHAAVSGTREHADIRCL